MKPTRRHIAVPDVLSVEEMLEWLGLLSHSELPPVAREVLYSLIRAGRARVYRSPNTGEWMVWQAIRVTDQEHRPEVRKPLWCWVAEWLNSRP